jgi:CRP/FNR family transcriptional regulator, cyclic AMP receptor protein
MKQLNIIEKAFVLKKTPLFKDLDMDLLVAIADKTQQDLYDKNETVFSILQGANRMFIIAKGSVGLYDNTESLIVRLDEGDFFGDESLFNGKPREYTAISLEDTTFLTFSKPILFNIISECPSVATSLLEIYAQNICCHKTRNSDDDTL